MKRYSPKGGASLSLPAFIPTTRNVVHPNKSLPSVTLSEKHKVGYLSSIGYDATGISVDNLPPLSIDVHVK